MFAPNSIRALWCGLRSHSDREIYLSIFRVYLAFHILKKISFQWPYLSALYGPRAFEIWNDTGKVHYMFPLHFVTDHITMLYSLYGALAVLMALGIGRRLTIFFVFALTDIFQTTEGFTLDGGDNLLKFLIFYMIFCDSFRYLSLSPTKFSNGAKLLNLSTNLGIVSILFHVMMIYFISGISKMHSDVWYNGIACYYIFLSDRFGGGQINRVLAHDYIMITLVTYSTMLWEVLFPVAIWIRRLRPWVIAFGVAMHLGIYWLMMIHDFEFLFISTYGLFLRDDDWRVFLKSASSLWMKFIALIGAIGRRSIPKTQEL